MGKVLMPCRALGAFGRDHLPPPVGSGDHVLMPCRALGAFGPISQRGRGQSQEAS